MCVTCTCCVVHHGRVCVLSFIVAAIIYITSRGVDFFLLFFPFFSFFRFVFFVPLLPHNNNNKEFSRYKIRRESEKSAYYIRIINKSYSIFTTTLEEGYHRRHPQMWE